MRDSKSGYGNPRTTGKVPKAAKQHALTEIESSESLLCSREEESESKARRRFIQVPSDKLRQTASDDERHDGLTNASKRVVQ
jgi:hypothetical protein